MLSTYLAPPVLRRLHSVISDFRPPSITRSGEAVLLRLFPSRAIGGSSLTSDDLASGPQTVCQSSRVARPQDASQAPHPVSLLSSSARSYLDAYEQRMPVVTLIQFSSTADHVTWVSFAIWLKLDPSGLLKMLLSTLVSFLLPGRLVLSGSLLMRVQAMDIFCDTSISTVTGLRLYHVEFLGAPGDAQNWFVGSADIKNAFHQMRISGWLQAFFALPAVLALEVGCTGKNDRSETSFSRFFDVSCPYDASNGFFSGDVFLSECQ